MHDGREEGEGDGAMCVGLCRCACMRSPHAQPLHAQPTCAHTRPTSLVCPSHAPRPSHLPSRPSRFLLSLASPHAPIPLLALPDAPRLCCKGTALSSR